MNDQGSDFTPDELDRLEDALGALGDPAASGELEALPPKLRERLGEYDAIFALAREALPMEDVDDGVLAGILAEARQSAPAAAPPAERGPGLWERLRRSFMLPGLALAGTAALLLWVARPDGEALPELASPERANTELAKPIEASPSPAASEAKGAAPPAPKDMADEAVQSDSPTAGAPGQAAAPEPDARREAPSAPASKPRASGGYAPSKAKKAEADDLPLPGLDVPEEKRVDADKESVRDQLERGEAARLKGRCRDAEAEYAAVARSNGPASERARALIGLGLCREADGDLVNAERYYAQARDLDPTASQWLRGERDSLAKRAAKTKKSKATVDGL